MTAKIATYNSESGKGLLILENNKKINFSIDDWSNFDILPQVGQMVIVKENGEISPENNNQNNSESLNSFAILVKKKDNYLNGSIANGWKVLSNNTEGFVMTFPKPFSIGGFIVWSILLSLIFGFILGLFGVVIAIIIAIVIALPKNETTLKGTIDYEKREIMITKNGKYYTTLNSSNIEDDAISKN